MGAENGKLVFPRAKFPNKGIQSHTHKGQTQTQQVLSLHLCVHTGDKVEKKKLSKRE